MASNNCLSLAFFVVGLPLSANANVSFEAPRFFEAPAQPNSVVVGDFNGDGAPDAAMVVVGARFGRDAAIILGSGDGAFGSPQIVSMEPRDARRLAIGDFNGDRIPDLAVATNELFGGPGSLSILLGNGDGTFRAPLNFPTGRSLPSTTIAVGDFDNDGHLDAALGSYGSSAILSVLRGHGDGTFELAFEQELDFDPYVPGPIAVADFDGDGSLDLAMAAHGPFVTVLLGHGDGSFSPPTTYRIEGPDEGAQSVVTADFNGDGHPDLAVAVDGAAILLGNGEGTFQPSVTYEARRWPVDLAVGDFNQDGVPDLVIANNPANEASVLLGRGDGTFEPALTFDAGASPSSVAVGDFNGDDVPDFVVADERAYGLTVILSKGDGSFRARPSMLHGIPTWSVAADDVNGDGVVDLLVTRFAPSAIQVLLNQGDGSFAPPILTPVPSRPINCGPVALATGDFNRDRKLDVSAVDVGVGIVILLGNGDGGFSLGQVADVGRLGTNPGSIASADIDGDGILDLVVAVEISNTVVVGLGVGDGTFRFRQVLQSQGRPQSIAVDDFDGDGFADIAVSQDVTHNISVLRGHGDGTFDPPVIYDTGGDIAARSRSLVVGDLNQDGIPDLVATTYSTATFPRNQVLVFLGNGDGTFQSRVSFDAGPLSPSHMVVADFDGDGRQDLAIGQESVNAVSILLGNGDGTLRAPVLFTTGNRPNALAAADFNLDGKTDLATANLVTDTGDYSVSILINDTLPR